MSQILFQSSLAARFADFVKLKQLAGYDYAASAGLLMHFDRFIIGKSYQGVILDESTVHAYLTSIRHLAPRSFANRFGVIRLFSVWLNQHEPLSFVLDHRDQSSSKSVSRPAYIFNYSEIKRFLATAGSIGPELEAVPRLYQTLFSLLYATGVRIAEALALNICDFSVAQKRLHIREGKFRKERIVPLSVSVSQKLEQHLSAYRTLVATTDFDPIFIGMRGRRLIYNSAQKNFKRTIKAASLPVKGKYPPRLHDLRHTFAVHRLLEWYDSESDIYAKLPLLSTYMGHTRIASTQIYLQRTNELMRKGGKRFRSFYLHESQKPPLAQ